MLKQRIWKTKLPPKIKHIQWRLLSQSLADGSNLKHLHITQDSVCKRCIQAQETKARIFFECNYAKAVWRSSGISNTVIGNVNATFEAKMEECLKCIKQASLAFLQDLPTGILWRLWKSRNLVIFQKKNINWRILIQQGKSDPKNGINKDDHQDNIRTRGIHSDHHYNTWKIPTEGYIKCNLDSSLVIQK